MKKVTKHNIKEFQATVWGYYEQDGRHDLPWREEAAVRSPYAIVVSELMLQQTQVGRVIAKYEAWMKRWSAWEVLAQASLAEVLTQWQGLGYNRRAKFLHQLAQVVTREYDGQLPRDESALLRLPGLGPYTVAAVQAFAFNMPCVVIETNIRTVYIHHWWPDYAQSVPKISDTDLRPIVSATLDQERPREWYWALMDYGAWLKKKVGNVNRHSRQYGKQSRFVGSKRQVRGAIIRYLSQPVQVEDGRLVAVDDLYEGVMGQEQSTGILTDRLVFDDIVQQLVAEELVVRDEAGLCLGNSG